MDRDTVLRQLKQIEGLIARSQERVAFQRELIARIEVEGRDLEPARRILEECEIVLEQHLALQAKLKQQMKGVTRRGADE